jgi:hypothetical protein
LPFSILFEIARNAANEVAADAGHLSPSRIFIGEVKVATGGAGYQCGKPTATPEWIENGPRRTSYLWHCWACDYQFEAVAFFEESEALAA